MALNENRSEKSWGLRARSAAWTMFALVGVLALTLLIQVNVIGQRHFGRWDMTADAAYSITDETQKDLRALSRNVEIYVVGPMSPTQGDEAIFHAYDMVVSMLREFQNFTGRLEIMLIPPGTATNAPSLQKLQSKVKSVSESTVYVVSYTSTSGGLPSDPRFREVPLRDCYSGDAATGKIFDFHAELLLMVALAEVAGDEKRVVYFTTSHGEVPRQQQSQTGPSFNGMAAYIGARLNLDFRELPSFGAVPADCDVLMIGAPELPFSKPEAEAIDAYVKKGGRVFVCCQRASPLTDVLRMYGVDICGDILFSQEYRLVVPCLFTGPHPIVRHQSELRKAAAFYSVASARKAVSTRGESNLTELMITGTEVARFDRVQWDKDEARRPIDDQPKAVAVAVAAQQSSASKAPKKYRIVAVGWPVFLDRLQDPEDMAQFTLNSFKWLLEREALIAAPSKRSDKTPLKLEPATLNKLFWTSLFGFPGVAIVLGLVAWGFRRK